MGDKCDKCDNCIEVRDPYATGDHWYVQYECCDDQKHCLGQCQQCGEGLPESRHGADALCEECEEDTDE